MTELDGFDARHSYRGHDLFLAWDISDDCMKRDYIVRLPSGEIRYVDWSPYQPMTAQEIQNTIENWIFYVDKGRRS